MSRHYNSHRFRDLSRERIRKQKNVKANDESSLWLAGKQELSASRDDNTKLPSQLYVY